MNEKKNHGKGAGRTVARAWGMIVPLSLLLLAGHRSCPQDMHFSQFFETPLLRNPSLAGIFTGDLRIQGVYRNQWSSVTDGYRTGSFNAEYKRQAGQGDNFITLGFQALFDKSGTVGLSTTEILPAFNYHKSLSDERNMYLSLGFMGGYVEKAIDRSRLTTNNQFDGGVFNPSLGDGETFTASNIHYLDGSIGLSFNTGWGEGMENNMFVGAAAHHLNRPRNSFYMDARERTPKYVFSGGMKFAINEFSYFTLQADETMQGGFRETVGGCLYSHKLGNDPDKLFYTVHLGAFIRWQDAFIPVVKVDMYNLAIALSYDVTVSALRTASQGRGGVELSVAYIAFSSSKSSKGRILCPRF